MFKCTGNCKACGRCQNIFPNQIEKSILFPKGFLKHILNKEKTDKNTFGISFDVGTTTIAAALWNLNTNEKIKTIGGVNPQRNFGADVLSRISFCQGSHEKHEMLRTPLLKTFEKITLELIDGKDISLNQIEKCVFCGNTTMTLLLAGLTIDGLAQYPFTPDKTEEMKFDFYVDGYKLPSIILAGISGHIGGDITASMLASGMTNNDENSILLDLGTNGEVICKIDGQLYGFSTAAGPAFEGANISCGMSATVGAIDSFQINDSTITYHMICGDNGDSASNFVKGICGTGLMSAISQMLQQRLINKNGDLSTWDDYKRMFPYNMVGNHIGDQKIVIVNQTAKQTEISITQQDIREIQMAKAALLAGIKLLFHQVNVDPNSINTVYLAGGFSKISEEVLNNLNIFPFDISGKLKCIGNGALTGASMVLLDERYQEKSHRFSELVNRIELGESPQFQKEFLEAFAFKI